MPDREVPLGTILLAHDSGVDRELLTDHLRVQGYRVIDVESAKSAVDALAAHAVDLVLLNVRMPGCTGFSLCQDIKSSPETRLTPVVLVTGSAGLEDRIRGIESGADDFLHKPVRKEELLARVKSLVRLKRYTDELENAETVLCSLARSIEAKDPYTEGHCDRLSHYAVALAGRLGLSEEQQVALRRAGIVHDIGKVAVPEQILLKPGPLTDEERGIMQSHVLIGERICSPLKSFRQVLPIIRHHHERMNGTGYPDGLTDGCIPLTARILQTVDVYDALTTDRPYRRALAQKEAFAVMREEVNRGWWDGSLVSQFEQVVAGWFCPKAVEAASAGISARLSCA